jgi:hypothetical protein
VKQEIKSILKQYDTEVHGKPVTPKYLDRFQ